MLRLSLTAERSKQPKTNQTLKVLRLLAGFIIRKKPTEMRRDLSSVDQNAMQTPNMLHFLGKVLSTKLLVLVLCCYCHCRLHKHMKPDWIKQDPAYCLEPSEGILGKEACLRLMVEISETCDGKWMQQKSSVSSQNDSDRRSNISDTKRMGVRGWNFPVAQDECFFLVLTTVYQTSLRIISPQALGVR